MSDTPPRSTKLIVVIAFDIGDDGELQPVFGPSDYQSENLAVRVAAGLASKHSGVIAWSREADPAVGEYGSPTILFQAGNVPDIEWRCLGLSCG